MMGREVVKKSSVRVKKQGPFDLELIKRRLTIRYNQILALDSFHGTHRYSVVPCHPVAD